MRELVDLIWDFLNRHFKLKVLFILFGGFGIFSLGFMAFDYIKKNFLGWMFLPARLLPILGFLLYIIPSRDNLGELPKHFIIMGILFGVIFYRFLNKEYQAFKAGKPVSSPGIIKFCGLLAIALAVIEIRQVFEVEVWKVMWEWSRAVVRWLLRP